MDPERLRDALRRQPFERFALTLEDGKQYIIAHPDFLAIPPGKLIRDVVFWTERGANRGDYETHWISMRQIVELIVPATDVTKMKKPPQAGDA